MPKIDFETAERLARDRLKQYEAEGCCEVSIMTSHTRTTEIGWVFFYNSTEFLETGSLSSQLAGNCPIVVTFDGSLHELPTYESWETGLAKLIAELKKD